MPQLHLYVPKAVEELLRERAKSRNMSLSKYLAEIVQRETQAGWPEGYFQHVVGAWSGTVPKLMDLPLEEREPL